MTRRQNTRGGAGRVLLYALSGTILGYLMLPMLVIVPVSFTSVSLLIFPPPGWSLRWYEELVINPAWATAAWNSLRVGLTATALATFLGTTFAMACGFGRVPFRRVIVALMLAPMIVPVIITGVGLFYFFSIAGLAGSFVALAIGHTVIGLPFVVICVLSAAETFDRNLLLAAQSLGAPPIFAFRRVLLPLIAPGVLSGALFAFTTSLDDVVLAIFLGGPEQRTLPRQILSGVRETISPSIASVSVVLTLLSILLWQLFERLQRRLSALRARIVTAAPIK